MPFGKINMNRMSWRVTVLSLLPAMGFVLAGRANDVVVSSGPSGDETANIQSAIDAVHASGGGRVVLKGTLKSRTLYLKSHVELHLAQGAVLLGGDRPEDYDDVADGCIGIAPENSRKAFLVCLGGEDVTVSGDGTIDGQGVSFYDTNIVLPARFFRKPPIPRPRMVEFFNVRGVRFEGVTLKDSPGWTCWLRSCEDIAFEGVSIVGDKRMINNDGIDFDACRNMRVKDCRISTGDDCLVMRAIRGPDGAPAVCENLHVSGCTLSSACQGVRLGCPSDDTIRHALFENCSFRGHNGVMSHHPYVYLHPGDEGFCRMEDIVFRGWEIEADASAVFLNVEGGIRLRDFGHIVFKDCRMKSRQPLRLTGSAETRLRDVRFENVSVEVADGSPVTMNAVEDVVFDRFSVRTGPGEAKPFVRVQGNSWETGGAAPKGP